MVRVQPTEHASTTDESTVAVTGDGTPISVAGRVMAILDAFVTEGPQLRTGDVSRITGLPSATTGRLLKELVEFGGLRRLGRGRYSVGPRLRHIGAVGTALGHTWSVVQPSVAALAKVTGSSAHLSVLSGCEALRLAEARGEAVLVAPCWVIERLPLHATAAGLVFLAFGAPGLAEHILSGPMQRYTPHTLVAEHQLLPALDDIRRTGFAVSREQHRIGQSVMAVPVLNRYGQAVAALEVAVRRTGTVAREGAALGHYARLASARLASSSPHHETVTPLTQRRSTTLNTCPTSPIA